MLKGLRFRDISLFEKLQFWITPSWALWRIWGSEAIQSNCSCKSRSERVKRGKDFAGGRQDRSSQSSLIHCHENGFLVCVNAMTSSKYYIALNCIGYSFAARWKIPPSAKFRHRPREFRPPYPPPCFWYTVLSSIWGEPYPYFPQERCQVVNVRELLESLLMREISSRQKPQSY